MGNMDGCLGNATPTHWWKSPRWIVIRIEALAVVAIIFSFFLAALGSWRRWSNRWIVQKGFFIAQVLSLSLGTYSIGLMQSSSVKSEMYPIWTVSLFALFGCIDPVTTYNGLDYKGPLSKVVYGICLNCAYVLVISISTISSVVSNAAIITLSTITFIKGFHRSFALVQQNKIRDMVNIVRDDSIGETCVIKKDEPLSGGDKRYLIFIDLDTKLREGDIEESVRNNEDNKRLKSCYDVCVALCLSHKLQRHILGLDYRMPLPQTLTGIDFKWALKVIEIQLAFVYDAFFTSNPFLHYYQTKTASFWGLVSLIGICFVLVATVIPRGMTGHSGASGGCTKVVGTTTADLAITFGILVSLALLQLTQLVWSWTSNWARAAVACSFAFKEGEKNKWQSREWRRLEVSGWMRLKLFVATSTNMFDKYLWQEKIGQYSILPEPRLLDGREREVDLNKVMGETETKIVSMERQRVPLVQTLGLHYIWQVIGELLSTKKSGGVMLDEDVKGSVIDFLGQIHSNRLDRSWLSSLPEEQQIRYFLPHFNGRPRLLKPEEDCYRYTNCVMTWHIVTWYCERAEKKNMMSKQVEVVCIGSGRKSTARDHRHVANALSRYCIYLVKSAPELLPGPAAQTKRVYDQFVLESKQIISEAYTNQKVRKVSDDIFYTDWYIEDFREADYRAQNCKALAKLLLEKRRPDEIWKMLALVWVQLLVYAAPYGNVEAHMRRLSQGGEFITHLWALLYHLDIREWKVQGNLAEITTIEDADRILAEDDQAVVALLYEDKYGIYHEEVVTASRLEDSVKYYYTSDKHVFKHLMWNERNKILDLIFLKKEANRHRFSFYEGEFRAYDIASFVIESKIALAHDQAQAQSSGDNGGQSEARIEEEIQPHPIP